MVVKRFTSEEKGSASGEKGSASGEKGSASGEKGSASGNKSAGRTPTPTVEMKNQQV